MIKNDQGATVRSVRYFLVWRDDDVAIMASAAEAMEKCERNPGSRVEAEVFWYEGRYNNELVEPRRVVYPLSFTT